MKHQLLTLSMTLLSVAVASAQEVPASQATPEHQWLKKMVGTWESETDCKFGPDDATQKASGRVTSKMIGDLWLTSEIDFKSPAMNMTGLQMVGYDPEKKTYVGTWVDSVMNHKWEYTGSVNDAGDTLTLEAEGPSMTGEGTTMYRDVYKFTGDDTIQVKSLVKTPDGEWSTFMSGTSKRIQK